ncbi:MAG: hypothetical protein AMK70_02695 [Nitrospira bacterium SG8_35_1]|nr:MAG: hypothetical protein AMK70_02695 [Nitrospira bacterium SG8_35_1]
MGKFQKKFDDLMSAVTFAEAGEFDTAQEFLNDRGKVLFATKENQTDNQAFTYAMSICRRIGASLDILYVSSKKILSEKMIKLSEELEKEGIKYSLSIRKGCLQNQIIDYTNVNKGILFVVIESSRNLDDDCRRTGKKMSDAWKSMKCPLVVVSELEKA